jgi:hypothetical protein
MGVKKKLQWNTVFSLHQIKASLNYDRGLVVMAIVITIVNYTLQSQITIVKHL